ncbi:MAG: helix-turn-helix domain-containing protein [Eubacteriales bacterium]
MLRLKSVRIQRGWSLTKLCLLTGIDPSNLSRLERGYVFPYPGWREKLAKAFEMPEEELFQEVRDADCRAN